MRRNLTLILYKNQKKKGKNPEILPRRISKKKKPSRKKETNKTRKERWVLQIDDLYKCSRGSVCTGHRSGSTTMILFPILCRYMCDEIAGNEMRWRRSTASVSATRSSMEGRWSSIDAGDVWSRTRWGIDRAPFYRTAVARTRGRSRPATVHVDSTRYSAGNRKKYGSARDNPRGWPSSQRNWAWAPAIERRPAVSTGVARPPARRRRRQASDNLEEGCDRKRRTSLRWKTSPEAPLLLFFFACTKYREQL